MTETLQAAIYGNDDRTEDLTDNDQDPTEPHPTDYRDWWTGNEPWRELTEAELYADPLLAHMLGAPNTIQCAGVIVDG